MYSTIAMKIYHDLSSSPIKPRTSTASPPLPIPQTKPKPKLRARRVTIQRLGLG